MFLIWNLGSQTANLAAFNQLNNAHDVVMAQGSDALKTMFEQAGLNYPNQMGTERYAEPVIHPTDGRVAMSVSAAFFQSVPEMLKNELWTFIPAPAQIIPELPSDWLPMPEEA